MFKKNFFSSGKGLVGQVILELCWGLCVYVQYLP